MAQGAAAAARIAGMITKGQVMIEPIVASINEEECSGCRICNTMCPYNAIEFDEEKNVSRVITALCKGCGTCVAACPAGVISGAHFNNEQIFAEIEGALWDAQGNGAARSRNLPTVGGRIPDEDPSYSSTGATRRITERSQQAVTYATGRVRVTANTEHSA